MRRRKAPQPAPPAAASDPATRRRKLADLEPLPLVDCISALPDELLGEIILLLPTVNMEILSLDTIVDLMRLFPCLEKLHVKVVISSSMVFYQLRF
jgi:hypothetical protein